MAPKRKRTEADTAKPIQTSTRVTRSATRRLNGSTSAASEAPAKLPKTKKKAKASSKGKTKVEVEDVKAEEASDASKTIVIEHCKQCSSFRKRADQVKDALKKDLSGITVLVNPEKPRRGCFEIREEGGDTFISLLDMKRPFGPMKALDMDKVISDIVDKIK
ncbi:uncharacterized protein LOC132308775 [Cornus florida]|uniref:uncharacterized protein LOC132308775 n=1 Tax=Cornus florida TaxID=4283 RepID=UPI00289AFBFC|nr:uncharacterized protein LOC132308775 [Cornus florida]